MKGDADSLQDAASERVSRAGLRGHTRRRAWIEVALLLVGLAVLVRIVVGIGEGPRERVYQLVGAPLLLVVAPHLLAVLAITLSWWSVIPRDRRARVRFSRLVPAYLAGDALNYLLPSATLGELTKVRLMRFTLPASDGVASVTLARVTDLFGLVAFGAVGTFCTAALRPEVSDAILFGGLAGVTALTVALAVAAWRGLFGGAVGLLRRLRPRSTSVRFSGAADQIDAVVRGFLRNDRALACSTAWRTAAWLVNVLELWIVFHLLGLHGLLAELTAMEGLIALWNGALFFIPARAGTTEGGWLLVAGLFGFTPAMRSPSLCSGGSGTPSGRSSGSWQWQRFPSARRNRYGSTPRASLHRSDVRREGHERFGQNVGMPSAGGSAPPRPRRHRPLRRPGGTYARPGIERTRARARRTPPTTEWVERLGLPRAGPRQPVPVPGQARQRAR